jgi:cytochrome P450
LAKRRENPGNAIIDALLDARDDQDRLSTDELVANLILFLVAGHETTTNLLSNGLRSLLRNPDVLEDLRANLDDPALVRNTVEEMLRHDGALFMSMRVALRSFEWHGRSIEKGQRVFLYHLSANRDPRVFEEHVAFGYGIHFCLGAPLARLEVEVALPALLRRYPDLALIDETVAWKTNFVLRGPTSLMLRA